MSAYKPRRSLLQPLRRGWTTVALIDGPQMARGGIRVLCGQNQPGAGPSMQAKTFTNLRLLNGLRALPERHNPRGCRFKSCCAERCIRGVANLFANEYHSHCACVMRHWRALRTCVVSLSKNGTHFVYQALSHSGLDTWVGHSCLGVGEHATNCGLLATRR